MAGWHYEGWRLGRLKGEFVATTPVSIGRQRYRLGIRTSEGPSAGRHALVAFVNAQRAAEQAEDDPSLSDIFAAYILDRQRDGFQTARMASNWNALEPTFGPFTLESLSEDLCRDYAERREDAGKARRTIETELARLRTAVKWYCDRNKRPRPPVWVPSPGEGRTRVITPNEAQRLIHAAVAPHVRLFLTLAVATGARTGALLELTWDRIDFDAQVIDLKGAKVPKAITDKSWKKGRAVVHMNGLARAALTAAYEVRIGDHVISANGGPIKKIDKGVRSAVARVGLTNVTAHTIRHSVATWLDADPTMRKQDIARLLGHRDVKTTEEHYIHPDAEATRAAADRLNLRVIRGAS